MKFTIAISLAMAPTVLALAAGNLTALASVIEINLGHNPSTGDFAARRSGQSKCTNVNVGAFDTNFCHQKFTLAGQSFTVEGCGAGLWIDDSAGKVYAKCAGFSEPDGCNIQTEFHCA